MRRYVALTLVTVGVVACGDSDDATSVVGGSSGAAGSTVVIDAGRGGGGSTGNGDASANTQDASVTPPVDASTGSDQATTPDAGVDVSADVGVDAANERAADAPSEVAVDVATDAAQRRESKRCGRRCRAQLLRQWLLPVLCELCASAHGSSELRVGRSGRWSQLRCYGRRWHR